MRGVTGDFVIQNNEEVLAVVRRTLENRFQYLLIGFRVTVTKNSRDGIPEIRMYFAVTIGATSWQKIDSVVLLGSIYPCTNVRHL
jgi:hypothetical protein